MTTTPYADLVDTALIARSREMHSNSIARLQQAESGVQSVTAAHAAAEAAANRAAAGEGDVSALDAEHALASTSVALTSAIRVRDAALARHARTEKNLHASEAMAWRPVAVAAGRARLAACAKFDDGQRMIDEAHAEYLAADKQGQAARANGCAFADNGLSKARALKDERLAWQQIRHAFDVDAGTFGGPPNGYIA